ncbi:hypothetical protein LVD17_11820 [Fulvivirga ulvae]|uniref:hypothetical protein n=1 Tax=Fulvivirga ulvae TaxID=2904245 RepID=UPI001F28F785|nr:hypothetical protein [Fulvivirga ulvae]UII34497.1 hypothetical protein LVD17_11820 [Fulvivirga ulvae]
MAIASAVDSSSFREGYLIRRWAYHDSGMFWNVFAGYGRDVLQTYLLIIAYRNHKE